MAKFLTSWNIIQTVKQYVLPPDDITFHGSFKFIYESSFLQQKKKQVRLDHKFKGKKL